MSEASAVQNTPTPNTVSTLQHDFTALGIQPGAIIILHSALSRLGWVAGGPIAVIEALLAALTPEGTLVMPAHSADNSDPAHWQNPPVPADWWPIIRAEMPPFRPEITPTRGVGIIPETFRRWPGALRSNHPNGSFSAWGKHAHYITHKHPLDNEFGDESPLGRLYQLDAQILLLGVTHANNTSLHLAEFRSCYPGKSTSPQGAAILVDGQRQWATWEGLEFNADDFDKLGADYEANIGYTPGKVGQAEARLLSQRAIVDYAVQWLSENRQA